MTVASAIGPRKVGRPRKATTPASCIAIAEASTTAATATKATSKLRKSKKEITIEDTVPKKTTRSTSATLSKATRSKAPKIVEQAASSTSSKARGSSLAENIASSPILQEVETLKRQKPAQEEELQAPESSVKTKVGITHEIETLSPGGSDATSGANRGEVKESREPVKSEGVVSQALSQEVLKSTSEAVIRPLPEEDDSPNSSLPAVMKTKGSAFPSRVKKASTTSTGTVLLPSAPLQRAIPTTTSTPSLQTSTTKLQSPSKAPPIKPYAPTLKPTTIPKSPPSSTTASSSPAQRQTIPTQSVPPPSTTTKIYPERPKLPTPPVSRRTYNSAARRATMTLVALPIAIVTSYVLYDRRESPFFPFLPSFILSAYSSYGRFSV
ncbi:hypothetical protein MMC25_007460 [Agyrium rufum]|nr:hypothetical protein [Agyrium rufum]